MRDNYLDEKKPKAPYESIQIHTSSQTMVPWGRPKSQRRI